MAQAQVARRVEIPRLHVFISYASEDAVLAQAINAELKTAFSQAIIRTTLDSEISSAWTGAPGSRRRSATPTSC
jgi:hypothetical protein